MSNVELTSADLTSARPATSVAGAESPGSVRANLRFFSNELRITFFRRRNQLLLLVAALFPLLIGIGLKAAAPHGGGGNGPGSGSAAFFNQLAGNGVFLTFIALSLLLILVLPVLVAVVAGDSIAGEAGYGTLRYLLTVPAGRTRLLLVKYVMIVVWCVAAVFIVSAVALAVGAVLFPVGPVTLLSGTTVSVAAGLVRVLWVTLYICAAMAAVGAIGLAISTFTEHAIGAIAAVMILVVASEVVDNIPQFATVAPYLPTHWWNSFDSILRTPIDTTTLWHGLLSFLLYAVIFVLIAWARFTSTDVTS
jgi:ABC-2 type transport system permease protein